MQNGAELGLPLTWTDFAESPIFFSNHVLVQHQPDEFVLTFSQLMGPPLTGTPDDRRQQAGTVDQIQLHTLGRYSLTRRRVTELIAILQSELQEHDRLLEAQRA